MSDNLPPSGGYYDKQPEGEPEYLDQGTGVPVTAAKETTSKKPLLIGGAAVAGLALVGGGVFAALALSGGGAQPSEALPADTLGYVSIDLDPSASQKIEAIQMFRKFPALKDELNMDADEDIRKRLFDELQQDGECEGVTYADDIDPWLGDRAAVAALEVDGEPTGVGIFAIKDGDAAEEGVDALRAACGGDSEGDDGAFVISGEWAVVAETQEIAETVIDRAAEGTLAEDEDHVRWMDEVGDPGILTMYAAPAAGELLASAVAEDLPELGGSTNDSIYSDEQLDQIKDDLILSGMSEEDAQDYVDSISGGSSSTPEMDTEQIRDEMIKAMQEFEGMGGTVRFDDGAVEMEVATATSQETEDLTMGDQAADLAGTLPEDTAAVFGLSLPEGWGQLMLDQMESYGIDEDFTSALEEIEAETGIVVPDDLETLTGEAMVVAVGGDFDPEAMANSADPSQLPVGAKIRGDADGIESVLDKIRAAAQLPADGLLLSEADGDTVAIGANDDYVQQLLTDGDLAGSDVYSDVLDGNDDAGMVLFLNFNVMETWAEAAFGDDPTMQENLEPLSGAGMTAWIDDSVSHVSVRLTTD